jgi:hypothetical protein
MATLTMPILEKPPTFTRDERQLLLARAVAQAVADGFRVETAGDSYAVLMFGQPLNHLVHLLATIATLGLWGIMWILLAFTWSQTRRAIFVDEFGAVQTTQRKV